MPKKSNKSKVIDGIFWDVINRMEDIDTSDDSEENMIYITLFRMFCK